jgi:hypothetical protein
LPKSAPIEGVVRDSTGDPVADLELWIGADIEALLKGDPEVDEASKKSREALDGWSLGQADAGQFGESVRTDKDGRFRAIQFPPWIPHFKVHSSPSDHRVVDELVTRHVGPGETSRIDLVARALVAGRVKGRLMLNGQPVQGDISWRGRTRNGRVEASSDGLFDLDPIEAGTVTVSTGRRIGGMAYGQLPKEYAITVQPGETITKDFDLILPLAPISGRVTSTRGHALPRLPVLVRGGQSQIFDGFTRTGEDGRWSIEVPNSKEPYEVLLQSPGIKVSKKAQSGSSDIDFVVPTPVRLKVRVVDETTREPILKSEISWRPAGSGFFQPLHSAWDGSGICPSKDGWWSFELSEGKIDLRAQASKLEYPFIDRRDVTLSSDGPEASFEIALRKGLTLLLELAAGESKPPGETIWLVLLDPDEKAAAMHLAKNRRLETSDIEQSADSSDWTRRAVHVGLDRSARIEGLRPGRYFIFAPSGHVLIEPSWVDVQLDGSTVAIRWKPE